MMNRKVFSLIAILAIGCSVQSTAKESHMFGDEEIGANPDGTPKQACFVSASGKIRVNTLQASPSDDQVSAQLSPFPDPGLYTVQFGIRRPDAPAGTTFVCTAEALITWTVGGNSITRRVSVAEGMSITGNAEGVTVVVSDTSVQTAGPPTDVEYFVTILISKGIRAPGVIPPTLNGPTVAVGNAGGTTVLVPKGAGINSVMVTASDNLNAGAIYPLGALAVLQNQGATDTIKSYDPRANEWVPLAAACDMLILTNNAGVGTSVRFNVTWGVDG